MSKEYGRQIGKARKHFHENTPMMIRAKEGWNIHAFLGEAEEIQGGIKVRGIYLKNEEIEHIEIDYLEGYRTQPKDLMDLVWAEDLCPMYYIVIGLCIGVAIFWGAYFITVALKAQ